MLGLPAEPASAPRLLQAVEDVSLDVARVALRRLVPLARPREVERLRARTLELDVGLVPDAAAALRRLGDRGLCAIAAEALESEALPRRQKAALALRELADPAARPALLRALRDPEPVVRRIALEALDRLPATRRSLEAGRRSLADGDMAVREAAVRLVAASDPDASETLSSVLDDPSVAVRSALAAAACVLDRESVLALLADPSEQVRAALLGALASCPRMAPVPALVEALADGSWHVRRAACDAVAAAGGEEAGAALVAALVDSRLEVRGRAVVALERLHGERLDEALEGSLDGAGARLRRALLELLGRRGRSEVALRYAADPVADVRIAAAHALAADRRREARSALGFLLRDEDAAVRNAAAAALASSR